MPRMISHRNFTLATTLGHAIEFTKGEPVEVPRAIVPEALERGCVLEDESFTPSEEKRGEAGPEDQMERNDMIELAMREIIGRNDGAEFSSGGVPTIEALSKELGWRVHGPERSAVWDKLRPTLSQA